MPNTSATTTFSAPFLIACDVALCTALILLGFFQRRRHFDRFSVAAIMLMCANGACAVLLYRGTDLFPAATFGCAALMLIHGAMVHFSLIIITVEQQQQQKQKEEEEEEYRATTTTTLLLATREMTVDQQEQTRIITTTKSSSSSRRSNNNIIIRTMTVSMQKLFLLLLPFFRVQCVCNHETWVLVAATAGVVSACKM